MHARLEYPPGKISINFSLGVPRGEGRDVTVLNISNQFTGTMVLVLLSTLMGTSQIFMDTFKSTSITITQKLWSHQTGKQV